MHDQILQDLLQPFSPLSSTHQAGTHTQQATLPHLSAPGVHPTPLPMTPLWTETEAAHLGLHPFSLPSQPNQRAHPSLCTSRVPQAKPLPLPCTHAAKPPPTCSEHVALDTPPFSTPRSPPVDFVHARLLHTTPAAHWRSHPCPLAR
jgi:hypothetical protein